MRSFFFGIVLGLLLAALGGYLFLTRWMPVATHGGPLPLERMLASTALAHAIHDEGARPAPIAADETNLLAGARIYRAQCEVCHGLVNGTPSPIARGMFPRPPLLLPPHKGVSDDPVGETWWKAKNGIRLTGMPGFGDSLTDTELWQVSLLLAHADKLPAPVVQALQR